jgi:hypothetical protein
MNERTGRGRYGSVPFELVGPELTNHSNYIRAISATNDGGKWVFVETRDPLPFEQVGAYKARRVRDRFTSEMLADYCRALGVHVFESEM